MLSQLKSYLFGGAPSDVDSAACAADTGVVVLPTENDDDWVLVDSQDEITELPEDQEDNGAHDELDVLLEESCIVTNEDPAAGSSEPSGSCSAAGAAPATRDPRRDRNQQPKGTKHRRLRAAKKAPVDQQRLDDSSSTTSSIAIIDDDQRRRQMASPGAATSAAAAAVLAASLADAKQVAAIASARIAKEYVEKRSMARNAMLRNNETYMAAGGRKRRDRCRQLMAPRICGASTNNSRKC